MCEQLCPEDLLKDDIDSLIKHCLKVEQDRKLSVNSINTGLTPSFPDPILSFFSMVYNCVEKEITQNKLVKGKLNKIKKRILNI